MSIFDDLLARISGSGAYAPANKPNPLFAGTPYAQMTPGDIAATAPDPTVATLANNAAGQGGGLLGGIQGSDLLKAAGGLLGGGNSGPHFPAAPPAMAMGGGGQRPVLPAGIDFATLLQQLQRQLGGGS